MPGEDEGDAPLPVVPQNRAPVHLSPRMTAVFGGLFGLAALSSLIALLIQVKPPRDDRAIVAGHSAGREATIVAALPAAAPEPKTRVRHPIPGPWRLAELEKEPSVKVERGAMEKKSLLEALTDKGVPKSEVYRVLKALDGVRKFTKSKKRDRFAVAFDRDTKKVKAFEYETTPSDVWQAREGEGGLLTGAKLDMKLADEEYTGAFYIGGDVTESFKRAGFEEGLLAVLDEALTGHMSTEGFEEGGVVRAIVVEETALGLFSRYKRVVAMEYRPPDPEGKPVRIYSYHGTVARGYWDEKGRQPNAAGWRTPCPGAPITSPFNPKRMHPVLHVIRPHTGTDFGGPAGTPIYATYKGVISSVGPAGACGNTVQIQHPGGIVTGYCHLSRFAGVKAGERVGTRQLIGYMGSTGRSTGPHLHFFVKKDGQFVDSRTLHMDGDRPVPVEDRPGFLAAKAELDRRLDAIPLPEPPPEAPKPVAAAASASAEPSSAEADASGKPQSSGRRAQQIGSPEAIAAARAEPGIHPSQFTEAKGDEDEDEPTAPPPGPKPGAGKPDPTEDEDGDNL